jgi:hypothetical protein
VGWQRDVENPFPHVVDSRLERKTTKKDGLYINSLSLLLIIGGFDFSRAVDGKYEEKLRFDYI